MAALRTERLGNPRREPEPSPSPSRILVSRPTLRPSHQTQSLGSAVLEFESCLKTFTLSLPFWQTQTPTITFVLL